MKYNSFKNHSEDFTQSGSSARKNTMRSGPVSHFCGNPSEKGVPTETAADNVLALHPRCPDPTADFAPLSDYLVEQLTARTAQWIDHLGRHVNLSYWKKLTRQILSTQGPGIQVIPAQAGSGKSTWILAFLLALTEYALQLPEQAESLGGVLLVVQKVETLNEIHSQLETELGKDAAQKMVALQSFTPSGKAAGLCPNPSVETHRQCRGERCPYAPQCPMLALSDQGWSAYILGVTQARFYGMRRKGIQNLLLQRECGGKVSHRHFLIFDEKPELYQIDVLSMGRLNDLSTHLEKLTTQNRLSDRQAAWLQSELSSCAMSAIQKLRRTTRIEYEDRPPKDALAGLCRLPIQPGDQEHFTRLKQGLHPFSTPEAASVLSILERLYNGEECLFCRSSGFHVTAARDGMAELLGAQVLIFDATAPVDGDYSFATQLTILQSPPPINTHLVRFHIYQHPHLNVSRSALRKPGLLDGLCVLVDQLLHKYPGPTFLCTYQDLSSYFVDHLSQESLAKLRLMPARTPPCVPYFGGTNGSNAFRDCTCVIILGYPRLDPETYLERTYAAWADAGFRKELLETADAMEQQDHPWKKGLRALPSVTDYENRHLAARLEQEIYRSLLRDAQCDRPIHVVLFAPPPDLWALLEIRFPSAQVEEIADLPSCIQLSRGNHRTYRDRPSAFAKLSAFLRGWEGETIAIATLLETLEISRSAWKELQSQPRFTALLEDCGVSAEGRGPNRRLVRRMAQQSIPA